MLQRVIQTPLAVHTVFDQKGCDACGGSGYKGRMGVYEAILIDEKVKKIITIDTRESAIRTAAKDQKIPTMQQDGVFKALAGLTSLDEVSRVLDLYHME